MTKIKKKWVLLPVEIKTRELDAKVMLACVGAERGYAVLLGRNCFNLNKAYPRGVYFDKCISVYKEAVLDKQVNQLGNILVSLDEEGLVYQAEEDYLQTRFSRGNIELSSFVFTWGETQRQMIQQYYNIQGKIIATGAPRADLWNDPWCSIYKAEAKKLSDHFGDFILIPANFGVVQHADPIQFAKKHVTKSSTSSQKDLDIQYVAISEKFIEMIPIIGERYRDLTIILRPHPNDDPKVWQELKKSWPKNIEIISRGNVTPWIYASKMIVHNNCTTGIEAFSMGKPAIAYTPLALTADGLPNSLSQQSNSVEGVLSLIERNLKNTKLGREEAKVELYNSRINYDNTVLAADRIFDAINLLELPEVSFQFSPYGVCKKIRTLSRRFRQRVNDFVGLNEFSYAYRTQKHPGVSLEELKVLVECYQKETGRWGTVSIEQVDGDVFCFYSNK